MSRLLTGQLMVTLEATKNAGHMLEPEEGWPAEGKGVTESPLYTFSGGPSKYPGRAGRAPTYRKSAV